jgi:hypothetical protein
MTDPDRDNDVNDGRPLIRIQQLRDALGGGERLMGGCDDCNSYQTVEQTGVDTFLISVFHDASCPYMGGLIG